MNKIFDHKLENMYINFSICYCFGVPKRTFSLKLLVVLLNNTLPQNSSMYCFVFACISISKSHHFKILVKAYNVLFMHVFVQYALMYVFRFI